VIEPPELFGEVGEMPPRGGRVPPVPPVPDVLGRVPPEELPPGATASMNALVMLATLFWSWNQRRRASGLLE
jgi:hypothetical protein